MSYLCGPGRPTPQDLAAVRQFEQWLLTQPTRRPTVHAVRRPQHCNCGANPLLNVAHLDTCQARRPAPR